MNTNDREDTERVTYLLRDIDSELWRRARARAIIEGRTMRDVLLDLVRQYAAGRSNAGRQRRRGHK